MLVKLGRRLQAIFLASYTFMRHFSGLSSCCLFPCGADRAVGFRNVRLVSKYGLQLGQYSINQVFINNTHRSLFPCSPLAGARVKMFFFFSKKTC